jgi:hypothetical protein
MSVRKFVGGGVLGACLAATLAVSGCAPSMRAGTPANENFVQPSPAQPTPALLGGPPGFSAMQATTRVAAPGAPSASSLGPSSSDGERG